jgi:hypothetical protein
MSIQTTLDGFPHDNDLGWSVANGGVEMSMNG